MSQVIVFSPDIRIYRGTRQITGDMLPAEVQHELPPAKIASLGKLVTLDKEACKPLIAIRQKATRALEAAGTPFMGGYGVGLSRAAELSVRLTELKAEFYSIRAKLLSSYNERVATFSKEFPTWATYITQLAGSEADVAAGTIFTVRKYRAELVELPGDNDAVAEVKNLPVNLRTEADLTLRTFLADNLGKDKVYQRGMRPLRNMADKLVSLSFLDGSLLVRATEFDGLITGLPKSGPVEGVDLDSLKANMRLLLGEKSTGPQSFLFAEDEEVLI